MPDPNKENHWNRLVDAAKDAGATTDGALEHKAPSTFVSGVIAMREGLWKFTKIVLLRRLSLVAAILAIALWLILYSVMKSNEPARSPAPALPQTLPQPPDPEQ